VTANESDLIESSHETGTHLSQAAQPHHGLPYLVFLKRLSQIVWPNSYLEIGTRHGSSLAAFPCDAICVDPVMRPATEALNRKRTFCFQMTSDQFFRDHDVFDFFPRGVDIAFLDGMHQYEFLLRDFINTERYCHRRSLIILHDCLPTTAEITTRVPPGGPWAGDVWKMVPILKEFRNDLRLHAVDCPPTGLLLIQDVDPHSEALLSHYDSIVERFGDVTLDDYTVRRLSSDLEVLESRKLLDDESLSSRYLPTYAAKRAAEVGDGSIRRQKPGASVGRPEPQLDAAADSGRRTTAPEQRVPPRRGLIEESRRQPALWDPGQHVNAADLDRAERVSLTGPAFVPPVHTLRATDRLWRPGDYSQLPIWLCQGPGYTLLQNAFLVSPGVAFTDDGRFITDDRTLLTPAAISSSAALRRYLDAGSEARMRGPVADQALERGILISGPGLWVYGHVLVDYLPALAILDGLGEFRDWPVLLPESAPGWVFPMVDAFSGHREVRRFPNGPGLRTMVGELCVPWTLREPAFHPIAKEAFDRVAESAGRQLGNHSGGGRRLYVSRGSEEQRRLENAGEVEALFAARGFDCVEPGRLPFLEQVRMFMDAETVAGEAGSGLHGTVFARAGTLTLELRPRIHRSLAQPAIAVLKAHAFASCAGTQRASTPTSRSPWTMDLGLLDRWLSEVER